MLFSEIDHFIQNSKDVYEINKINGLIIVTLLEGHLISFRSISSDFQDELTSLMCLIYLSKFLPK
jgi:hypothetical protein